MIDWYTAPRYNSKTRNRPVTNNLGKMFEKNLLENHTEEPREFDGPSKKEPDPITIICSKNEPDPITIVFPRNEPDQIVI